MFVLYLLQATKFSLQYAQLVGHQNKKQRIHHVEKLTRENIALKRVSSVSVYLFQFNTNYLFTIGNHETKGRRCQSEKNCQESCWENCRENYRNGESQSSENTLIPSQHMKLYFCITLHTLYYIIVYTHKNKKS